MRDTVGKYVEPGLPDHSHTVTAAYAPGGNAIDGGNNYQKISSGTLTTDNASASNSIYGNSTTVQPAATQMYLYFYVGNFSQTALENTAGLNAELFNDKLDLDAGNATSTTKKTVIGWMLPDYANATQETAPFTATANGFIYFSASAYGAGNSCDLNIDGITACGANASIASFTVPIAKGRTATIVNTGSGSGSIKFIPCKGN